MKDIGLIVLGACLVLRGFGITVVFKGIPIQDVDPHKFWERLMVVDVGFLFAGYGVISLQSTSGQWKSWLWLIVAILASNLFAYIGYVQRRKNLIRPVGSIILLAGLVGTSLFVSHEHTLAVQTISGDSGLIAFTRGANHHSQIYVTDARGGNVRPVTDLPAYNDFAAWSPKQARLAFISNLGHKNDGVTDIWTVASDGSDEQNLTLRYPGSNLHPTWSPDGSEIAFQTTWHSVFGQPRIAIINADGEGSLRFLSPGIPGAVTWPDWSRQGRLLFTHKDRDGYSQLWRVDRDSNHLVQLTRGHYNNNGGRWSPNGRNIVFVSDRNNIKRQSFIYLMSSDGQHQRKLTATYSAWESTPDWSPNGINLVFVSSANGANGGQEHLFRCDLHGGSLLDLTHLHGDVVEDDPAWS